MSEGDDVGDDDEEDLNLRSAEGGTARGNLRGTVYRELRAEILRELRAEMGATSTGGTSASGALTVLQHWSLSTFSL